MTYTHQYSALKIWGHPSKKQPPNQAGNGGEDESPAQSPGNREMISCNKSISTRTGQITTTAWGKIERKKKLEFNNIKQNNAI